MRSSSGWFFMLNQRLFALLTYGPSEVTEKTGKYVCSVLEQLKKRLGVHAVMFVTYRDIEGEVKISECVCSKCCWLKLTYAKL